MQELSPMPLQIEVTEQRPGLYVVALDGRLDTNTSPQLENRFQGILAKEVLAVRFDMSRLDYVSSMGIQVLFKTFKALRQKQALVALAGLQPQIRKVLEIAQALPAESVFASEKEADEYFDAMQKKALGQTDAD
jgi:anti-anti-sigma factor